MVAFIANTFFDQSSHRCSVVIAFRAFLSSTSKAMEWADPS
jgi:hypothetical protein